MSENKTLNAVAQIESLFAEDKSFFLKREKDNLSLFKKLKMKHLYALPSMLTRRIYKLLPNLLKDIIFWPWVQHRAPATKYFANTRYDELRTLIDIKLSSMVLRSFPQEMIDSTKNTFDKGFFLTQLNDISELDIHISDVINYSKPSHAGARPYLKDGKNKEIQDSFSAYYDFSTEANKHITSFMLKRLDNKFNYHLSALAGYRCRFKDISYSLGIVYGENSNSEMHQDTFASIAKGFIYLQDVTIDDSPFEYMAGSYKDAAFRSLQSNNSILINDIQSSGATRLRGKQLEEATNKYSLQTFIGRSGTLILANTAAYHRKGLHNSTKPRITLNFEIKRKGLIGKLFINLSAVIRFNIIKLLKKNG